MDMLYGSQVYRTDNIKQADRLRRLDALFAERVLGREVQAALSATVDYIELSQVAPGIPISDSAVTRPLRPYTRSLDAAWEGVASTGWEVEFSRQRGTRLWACRLIPESIDEDSYPSGSGVWFHPAEALVLACLRAVGVTEEEIAAL
jgi:hypothetical protein